jgi:hypothetical protein
MPGSGTIAVMNRREQMSELLSRRERLGLTLRELSAETGIPTGTLGFWAWKLRQAIEPDRSAPASGAVVEFVELIGAPEVSRPVERRGLEVVLVSGRRVVVREDFDEERLVRLVRALERC